MLPANVSGVRLKGGVQARTVSVRACGTGAVHAIVLGRSWPAEQLPVSSYMFRRMESVPRCPLVHAVRP